MQKNLDGINMELHDRVRHLGKHMICKTLSNPNIYLRTISDYQVFDSLVKAVNDEHLQSQWDEIRARTKVRIYVADYRRRARQNDSSST